jgi:apolipoprotein N-acyltransferase
MLLFFSHIVADQFKPQPGHQMRWTTNWTFGFQFSSVQWKGTLIIVFGHALLLINCFFGLIYYFSILNSFIYVTNRICVAPRSPKPSCQYMTESMADATGNGHKYCFP